MSGPWAKMWVSPPWGAGDRESKGTPGRGPGMGPQAGEETRDVPSQLGSVAGR